jgi:transposase
VSERLGLSWDEIQAIMERAMKRGLQRRKKEPVPLLGIDEKAFHKVHNYSI